MKNNNKGFTLIELIATISILALIMLLSVPNVMSMVDKNKRNAYIMDARKLVKTAKYKFNSSSSVRPASNYCVKYKLSVLDTTNINNPPNDGKYIDNYSYVIIKYNSSSLSYDYTVQLVEEYKDLNQTYYRGVKATLSTNLTKQNAKMKYVPSSSKSLNGYTTMASYNCTTY